jgi:hypothetical protein
MSGLTEVNFYTRKNERLTAAMADPVEMGLLPMNYRRSVRTPTFTMFGKPDSSSGLLTPGQPAFAWIHGGIQPEIAQTSSA